MLFWTGPGQPTFFHSHVQSHNNTLFMLMNAAKKRELSSSAGKNSINDEEIGSGAFERNDFMWEGGGYPFFREAIYTLFSKVYMPVAECIELKIAAVPLHSAPMPRRGEFLSTTRKVSLEDGSTIVGGNICMRRGNAGSEPL